MGNGIVIENELRSNYFIEKVNYRLLQDLTGPVTGIINVRRFVWKLRQSIIVVKIRKSKQNKLIFIRID